MFLMIIILTIVIIAFSYGIAYRLFLKDSLVIWAFFGIITPIFTAILEAQLLLSVGSFIAYIAGTISGLFNVRKMINKFEPYTPKQQMVETGASQKCNVCGLLQRSERLCKCSHCGKLFCNFPVWQATPRDKFDQFASKFGEIIIIIFFVMTAISVLGGILLMIPLLSILILPYFIIRFILPHKDKPSFWKQCGNDSLCFHCCSNGYEMNSLSDYSYDYLLGGTSNEDNKEEKPNENGSMWDGWLIKW